MMNKIIEKITNKEIAILGFGREGRSTYRLIRKYLPNKKLTIIDKVNYEEEFGGDENLSFVYGDSYLEGLDKYELIFKLNAV